MERAQTCRLSEQGNAWRPSPDVATSEVERHLGRRGRGFAVEEGFL